MKNLERNITIQSCADGIEHLYVVQYVSFGLAQISSLLMVFRVLRIIWRIFLTGT